MSTGVLLTVGPHPVPKRRLVNPELAGNIRDRPGCFHDHAGCFLTELRRELPVFPWHLISSFPVKIL